MPACIEGIICCGVTMIQQHALHLRKLILVLIIWSYQFVEEINVYEIKLKKKSVVQTTVSLMLVENCRKSQIQIGQASGWYAWLHPGNCSNFSCTQILIIVVLFFTLVSHSLLKKNESVQLFSMAISHSYSCKSESVFLGDGAFLEFHQERMQAFNFTNNQFGTREYFSIIVVILI